MTYRTLLALTLPLIVALPVSASTWSEAAKSEFVNQCITGAPDGYNEDQIVRYCDCSAGTIAQEFSEEEIRGLGAQTEANPEMQKRLIKATSVCTPILD